MSPILPDRLWHTWIARVSLALCVVALLFVVIVITYAAHLRSSAQALIISAEQIHSTADAEREIAMWRQRAAQGYSESPSPDGKGMAYQFQVGNGFLSRLFLTPHAGVLLQVTTFSSQLVQVLVGVHGNKSSVWVQEDFSENDPAQQLYVNSEHDGSGKPLKTILMFTSNLATEERKKVFALNASCLVKPGGCSDAEEILPTLPMLQKIAQTSTTR